MRCHGQAKAPDNGSREDQVSLALNSYPDYPCNVPMVRPVLNMMLKSSVLLLISYLLTGELQAQRPCTILGQTPQSAFPVCGTTQFIQDTVPSCGTKSIPVPGCSGGNAAYIDLNPYWYKFTCYASGTLGFLITPNNLGDDYDWQLFDITGHDPKEVFTNASLFVSGNWAGTYGLTGASASGSGNIQCASYPPDNVPTFSRWPYIIKGHQYLLLVSHFTSDNQSGYTLSFGGGSASITDTVQPRLVAVRPACGSAELYVKLNKKMKCVSLSSDGSDFMIGSGAAAVISANGSSCATGFDMDSVHLVLSQPLPTGQYTLIAKNGADNNTLLDNCGTPIPVGDQLSFETFDTVSAAFSYQVLWGCIADTILLQNSGAGITEWSWTVDGEAVSSTQNPTLVYSVFGDKNLQLVVSNPVCRDTFSQTVPLDNTLIADFEMPEYLCPADKASFVNKSTGHIVGWSWDLGDGTTDDHPTPADHYYPNNPRADKQYNITLIAMDNLGCLDTISRSVRKLHSCIIAVPTAFTPNGDGINDYLYPLNAFKADNLMFRVYNRYGQLIFETSDWTRKWDGTIGGKPQGPGAFVWTLQYTDRDTGQKMIQKGSSVLIR